VFGNTHLNTLEYCPRQKGTQERLFTNPMIPQVKLFNCITKLHISHQSLWQMGDHDACQWLASGKCLPLKIHKPLAKLHIYQLLAATERQTINHFGRGKGDHNALRWCAFKKCLMTNHRQPLQTGTPQCGYNFFSRVENLEKARGGREAITDQYVASLATYLVIRLLYHHSTSVC
jgi:hypothetical protein